MRTDHDEAEKSAVDKTIDAYEQYCNRHFVRFARQKLSRALDQKLAAASESLKPLLFDILQDFNSQIVHSFKKATRLGRTPDRTPDRTPPGSPKEGSPRPSLVPPQQRLPMPSRPPTPPPESAADALDLAGMIDPEFEELLEAGDLESCFQFIEDVFAGPSGNPGASYPSLVDPSAFSICD